MKRTAEIVLALTGVFVAWALIVPGDNTRDAVILALLAGPVCGLLFAWSSYRFGDGNDPSSEQDDPPTWIGTLAHFIVLSAVWTALSMTPWLGDDQPLSEAAQGGVFFGGVMTALTYGLPRLSRRRRLGRGPVTVEIPDVAEPVSHVRVPEDERGVEGSR